METVLLTWTISPNKEIGDKLWYKSTSLDPKVRYFSYIDTIVYYILNSKFTHIVFCENSNYPFEDKKLIEDLCYIYNKHFELLQFVWDHKKTLEKWYGYGDGECMDYAVDHSKLLKESKTWYKITWRYKISNINKIIDTYHGAKNIFYVASPIGFWTIMTWFIKTNTSNYRHLFYNIKEDVAAQQILEKLYYDRLTPTISYVYMGIYPRFAHISKLHYLLKVIESKLNYLGLHYINIFLRKILVFLHVL